MDEVIKNAHVAGWMWRLTGPDRGAWLERYGWVHAVDHLSASDGPGFEALEEGWCRLRDRGEVDEANPHQEMLERMRTVWFAAKGGARDGLALRAFDEYVAATGRYRVGTRLQTVPQFMLMLRQLSGSRLLSMPGAPAAHVRELVALGAADQLLNDVRDLLEHGAASVSRFPDELLRRFGVDRHALETGDGAGVRELVRHLVTEIAPSLRQEYRSLRCARTLPSAWSQLVREFEVRHALFCEVAKESAFDPHRFTSEYWSIAEWCLKEEAFGFHLDTWLDVAC